MLSFPLARRGARWAASGAAVILVGGLATPALADTPTLHIVGPSALALPLPSSGAPDDRVLSYGHDWPYTPGSPNPLNDFKLKFDGSALKGIAEIDFKDLNSFMCKVTVPGLVAECSNDGGSWPYVPQLPVKALPGAKNGQSGVVKVTGSASNAKVEGTETTVVIGGSDVTVKEIPSREGVKIGSVVDARIEGANLGTLGAPGLIVLLNSTTGLDRARQYSNCEYAEDTYRQYLDVALCRFDTEIAPGEKYSISGLFDFKVGSDALHENTQVDAFPFSDEQWAELHRYYTFKPGAGSKLALDKLPAARSAAPDLDPYNNTTSPSFMVDSSADLSVPSVSAKGNAGDIVKVDVAIRNEGPGRRDTGRIDEPFARLKVEIPTGSSVVKAPDNCNLLQGDETDMEGKPLYPGHETWSGPAYNCWIRGVVYPGQQVTVPFELRIDKVVPDAKSGLYMRPASADKNPANDSAALVLNPTTPPATGGTTGGTTTGGTTGGQQPPGDTGPELAETGGSSSSTPLIAGVAGGLLVVAAGAFVVVRRRKGESEGAAAA